MGEKERERCGGRERSVEKERGGGRDEMKARARAVSGSYLSEAQPKQEIQRGME